MTFSNRIKQIRGSLTQKQFAIELGVSLGAVQHWEIDNTPPNGSVLIKIRKVCKININWLLTGEGEPYDDLYPAELPVQPGSSNVIELQHMALVKGFRDKQRALNINQKLMELENLDAESFNHMEGYITGTVDSLRRMIQKMKVGCKQDDPMKPNGNPDKGEEYKSVG